MFIESIGIMLLTLPIFFPLLQAANVDMIWFGIIVIKLLEIGMITPPVGLNCYVISSRPAWARATRDDLSRRAVVHHDRSCDAFADRRVPGDRTAAAVDHGLKLGGGRYRGSDALPVVAERRPG
jgi:hypothetical protein